MLRCFQPARDFRRTQAGSNGHAEFQRYPIPIAAFAGDLGFSCEHCNLRSDCFGLHLPRRFNQRHLKRGFTVFSYRGGVCPSGVSWAEERGRLVRIKGQPASGLHAWAGMGSPHNNPLGVEWFSLVMGLGFVLSFGYWCTDFLVVQRAMAADSMNAARRTPLIAAVPKMLFRFLVILPGLIALAITRPVSRPLVSPWETVAGAAGSTLPAEQYVGGSSGKVPLASGLRVPLNSTSAGSSPGGEKYSSAMEPTDSSAAKRRNRSSGEGQEREFGARL